MPFSAFGFQASRQNMGSVVIKSEPRGAEQTPPRNSKFSGAEAEAAWSAITAFLQHKRHVIDIIAVSRTCPDGTSHRHVSAIEAG